MMNKFTYGSVCSGIEAVSVAWHDFAVPLWFSEIDKFPSAVLSHRFPDVQNVGDMLTIADKILSGEIPAPDVLVGGTPCQAFSVAGKRESLDDERGNLTLEFVKIADAIDQVRSSKGLPPCIILWENVPGVLNTKDNAFGCLLGGLTDYEPLRTTGKKWENAGIALGEKRNAEWRILDAQFFGVPQRRKRVFLIASVGKKSKGQILIERKSVQGNIESGRKTQQNIAAFTESRFAQFKRTDIAGTVKSSGGTVGYGSETLVIHGTQDPIIGVNRVHCLGCNAGKENVIYSGQQLRRLTPVECERLQGFPDDWTKIPYRGKSIENCLDSPRYKAIGNSMAVPVMRWIGKRIENFLGV